jgi:glutamine synthetase
MSLFLEYIWTDSDKNIRTKTKIIFTDKLINKFSDIKKEHLPDWNYDGSSTDQAIGTDSEVVLKPVAIFPNPFRKTKGAIVLCELYNPDGTPHKDNTRHHASELFEKYKNYKPKFGLEQEFFLCKKDTVNFFNVHEQPKSQGGYYCGVGSNNIVYDERRCMEETLLNCIFSGLSITGMNVEVAPSQWELQLCANGLHASDQLIVLRYIINRTAENFEMYMNIHPKPLHGDWNGSGCHVNFSTLEMRNEGGYKHIMSAINNLKETHKQDILNYGKDNEQRLSGKHETSSYTTFSYGIADRSSSIRIPNSTFKDKKGYFEDRRPASNIDPYVVTSQIFKHSLNLR